MRIVLLALLCIGLLEARENPFKPMVETQQMPVTDNTPTVKKDFQSREIQLPNGAKILKFIDLYYQDSTGEVRKKTVTIDQKIDWHLPLRLSHQKKQESVQKRYEPIAGTAIVQKGSSVIIETADKLLRNFHLADPFKVILDFKSGKSFYTKSVSMKPPFKKAVIGDHREYYRVVFELDAVYEYELRQTAQGVVLEFE